MSKDDGIEKEPIITLIGNNHNGKAQVTFDAEDFFKKYRITEPKKFYFTATTKKAKPIKSGYIEIIPPSFINPIWTKDGKETTNGILNEEITINCQANEMPEGKEIEIEIWEKDSTNPYDFVFALKSTVQNKKIEFNWKIDFRDTNEKTSSQKEISEKGYAMPEYHFVVRYLYFVSKPSPALNIKCNYIQQVKDKKGKPMSNMEYIFITPDGKEIHGKTDSDGMIKEYDMFIGESNLLLNR